MSIDFLRAGFREAGSVLHNFILNDSNLEKMIDIVDLMATALKQDGKILTCGNGGSMCDAMHFAEELTGRFCKDRRPLSAIALTDCAHISCVANDFGYDFIFSRSVLSLGRSGDLLLVFSTSGNSRNIINAVETAKQKGIATVALLGKTGGVLKDTVDYSLVVESSSTARIQEIHIKIVHLLIEGIERKIFPELY